MNISVYFYDEEGKYTHMDMTPLEFDSEGVQIIPESSTTLFPPDLSTDPRFSVELGRWVEQVEVEPISSADIKQAMAEMREAISRIETMQNKLTRIDKLSETNYSDICRTLHYLQVVLPNAKFYFDWRGKI